MGDIEKVFEEIEIMTKDNSINEVKKFFKGNKKFIEQAILLIYSTHHFEKINKLQLINDNWNWEKLFSISIDTQTGFKQFCYRKGNKKYAPSAEREGNKTYDIDEFRLTIYYRENQKIEDFTF